MVNKVEITITAKNNTKGGFAAARAEATKGGQEVADSYDKAVTAGTKQTGGKVGRQVSDDVVKGTKGTGAKVAKDIDDEIVKGTKDTGKKVTKQISGDLDGLHAQALKLNKVFNTANDKNLLSDADMKTMTARFKGIEEEAKASGKRAGDNFDKNMVLGISGGNRGFDNIIRTGLLGAAGTVAASGGVFGIALGAAVLGGLATALTAGGVVGIAGFLLKDNEKVKKAWGDTFKDVTEDAKRRAGFLEDEFVAGAERTAVAWDTKLGPALERIFVNAKPLVDDFIDMPTNWLEELAPGVEKAVKNAGPAVEGLDLMGKAIFKGFGDGLGEMSEHSEDFKTAMVMAGDAIGSGLKGALSTMGDMATWFAANKESVENFGRSAGNVFKELGKEAGTFADLLASINAPDGKNAKGDSWADAFDKMMGWDAEKPGDFNDPRNVGQLGDKVANSTNRAGQKASDYWIGDLLGSNAQPSNSASTTGTKAVQGSNLDSELRLLQVRKDMNTELGTLNYLNGIGLNQSQGAINANMALSESQAQLLATGAQMTTVTGNNTAANEFYIDAINRMTAAHIPASEALLNTVSGMNSTELAAMGATVRTDELGNSIISIPGQKDITVNAGTIEAQNAIAAVQGAVNSLTGKTVYVNVVTTGVASAASAVAGYAAAAAAAVMGRNKGGIIPGGGPNVDSKLIAATPGEFVVNRKATGENLPLLQAINEGAGGSAVMQEYSGGSSSGGARSSGGSGDGAAQTVVQLVLQPGRMSGMDRMFLSWVAEALQNNGGMAVNGWKA